MSLSIYLSASVVIVLMGLYGLCSKKNMIKILIALEIMVQGAVLLAASIGSLGGCLSTMQVLIVAALIVDAAVIAIACTIVIYAFKHYGALKVDLLKRLRW